MSKVNKSKTYLLPLLSEVLPLRIDFMGFITNTFIFDDKNKYENCIGILHDFSFKNPEFTAYEHQLTDNPYFVDLIDVDNQVLYIFRFPDEYIKEYNCFKAGKYSKFELDAKELILSFWSEVYSEQVSAVSFLLTLRQVLFKDKKLKEKLERELSSRDHKVTIDDDAELSSIINPMDETFELSKYVDEDEDKI